MTPEAPGAWTESATPKPAIYDGQMAVERTIVVSPPEPPVKSRIALCLLRGWGEACWLILCAGILAWKLLLPGFIGMADNGDFEKVAGPLCLASADPADSKEDGFFHPLYLRSQANCFQTHIATSESALAGLASILNRTLGDPARFDIRWLGAIHAAIFLAFYYSVLMLIRPLSGVARFALSLLALWIFADIGLLAYFNSFYSDTAAALGGLATAVLAVHLLAARRIAVWVLVLFGMAAVLFITSKAQHGLLGPIPAGLAFLMGWRSTEPTKRATAWAVGAALLCATAWIVAITPAWYKSQARFDLVFYKITRNSASPERDLAELGLGAQDARYIGMSSYVRGGPMEDAAWVDGFGRRCTDRRVILFYLSHPVRVLAILGADLAGQAWQRRVPGLTNFTRQSGQSQGALSAGLGSWSALRIWAFRKWPAMIMLWLLLLPAGALPFARRDAPLHQALAWTMAAVCAMALGEFGIASLADAIETPRHLLMFHVFSDVAIFLGLVFAACLLEEACPVSFRRPAFALVVVAITIFAALVGKFEIAATAAPVPPHLELPADAVDDTSPAVVYSGTWTAGAFRPAFRGTVTYSDRRGAAARFSFEGTELQYIYTKAPNRGIALVSIDGSPRGTVDLYDPQIIWQVRSVFGGLKAGPHQVEIEVLGRHDSSSSGDFVDIDALVGH